MGCWKPAKAEHRSERDRSNYKATCVSRETQTNEFLPYSGFGFSRNRVAKSLYTFFVYFFRLLNVRSVILLRLFLLTLYSISTAQFMKLSSAFGRFSLRFDACCVVIGQKNRGRMKELRRTRRCSDSEDILMLSILASRKERVETCSNEY